MIWDPFFFFFLFSVLVVFLVFLVFLFCPVFKERIDDDRAYDRALRNSDHLAVAQSHVRKTHVPRSKHG